MSWGFVQSILINCNINIWVMARLGLWLLSPGPVASPLRNPLKMALMTTYYSDAPTNSGLLPPQDTSIKTNFLVINSTF